MRWLFAEPGSADFVAKQSALQRIDAWWRAFAPRSADIDALFSRRKQWDLAGWMQSTLQAVDPRMMWEYGPGIKNGGHRLVVTPESARELRPLAAAIVKAAPGIAGWEFYNYRLPESVENAEASVQGRCNGTLDGVLVRPTVGEARRVDLTFFSPRARSVNDESALPEVFVGTESLLGEELLDHWIGAIDVEPLPKQGMLGGLLGGKAKPTNMLPLDRLHDTVKAVISSITEQLPPQPHFQTLAGSTWSVYQREPQEADDYFDRDDVMVGGTIDMHLVQGAMPGYAFHSPRFSRCNERFCYLKIDGEGVPMRDRFDNRGDLEEALDDVLIPNKLGCHVGGATGLRYTYVDFALVDVRHSFEAIRSALQGKVSRRSWLLFHDADLCGEWIGIYPDSPPPPLRHLEPYYE